MVNAVPFSGEGWHAPAGRRTCEPRPLIQARQIRPAAPVGARNLGPGRQIVSQDSPSGVSRIGGQAGTQASDPTPAPPQNRASRAGSTIHSLPAEYMLPVHGGFVPGKWHRMASSGGVLVHMGSQDVSAGPCAGGLFPVLLRSGRVQAGERRTLTVCTGLWRVTVPLGMGDRNTIWVGLLPEPTADSLLATAHACRKPGIAAGAASGPCVLGDLPPPRQLRRAARSRRSARPAVTWRSATG